MLLLRRILVGIIAACLAVEARVQAASRDPEQSRSRSLVASSFHEGVLDQVALEIVEAEAGYQ